MSNLRKWQMKGAAFEDRMAADIPSLAPERRRVLLLFLRHLIHPPNSDVGLAIIVGERVYRLSCEGVCTECDPFECPNMQYITVGEIEGPMIRVIE